MENIYTAGGGGGSDIVIGYAYSAGRFRFRFRKSALIRPPLASRLGSYGGGRLSVLTADQSQ